MENRVKDTRFLQRQDSVEFGLVRAKLRAEAGTAEQAVAHFRDVLAERRFADEAAVHYGYAAALLRDRQSDLAAAQIRAAREVGLRHPMLETLAARVKLATGDRTGAIEILTAARKTYPDSRGVAYDYADALISVGRAPESLDLLGQLVKRYPDDPKLYEMQAIAYSKLGKRAEQHRALAEMYLLKGGTPAAIEQLKLAQKAGDADFYVASAIDARLREIQRRYEEEVKRRKR
jgi:predicted Zn-dependent protease